MLEDKLTQGKQSGTYLTLSFSPHLPQSHSYGQRVPHGLSRGVHSFLSCLWINHPHPDDSPQELLMRVAWFLPPEPLQFFMVEEGLHPEVVVYSQGFELLGKRKVRKNYIMDLNCDKSVFNQLRPDLLRLPVVQMGSPLQISLELA